MKKLLLTLGAATAVATPVAAVVACGETTTTVTKVEVQKEFVADMAQVKAANYYWVIDKASTFVKVDSGTNTTIDTKDKVVNAPTTDKTSLDNHSIVFDNSANRELETDDTASYTKKVDGAKVVTTYRITNTQVEDGDFVVGVVEVKVGTAEANYYAFVANKKVDGVLIDHDATGTFYYSTDEAFKQSAAEIKVIAKDDEHAIKLGSLTDAELVEAWQGALKEIGLTEPSA